jgi:hypothetical protein
MNAKHVLLSLFPWMAFSLLALLPGDHAAAIAAGASAVLAAGIAVRNRGTAGYKLIDVAGVVCFAGLTVVAALSSASVDGRIADYGRGGSTLLLGLIMVGSVLVTPFTEQFAREVAPRSVWGSPVFRAVNRRLSLVWGGVALVAGVGHTYAGYRVDHGGLPVVLRLALNWGLPIVLGLKALDYTNRITAAPEAVTARAA